MIEHAVDRRAAYHAVGRCHVGGGGRQPRRPPHLPSIDHVIDLRARSHRAL